MKQTGIALLSAAALLAAGSATAGEVGGGSDISWTYLEAGYISVDGDDFEETDGFGLGGSIAITQNFHAGANWRSTESDGDGIFDVDSDYYNISLGWNTGLTTNSQAYFDLAYFDGENDIDSGGTLDDTGLQVIGGLRFKPVSNVELGGSVTYTWGEYEEDVGGADVDYNDTGLAVYGQYFIVPEFAVGARVLFNSNADFNSGDELFLYGRYSFGDLASL